MKKGELMEYKGRTLYRVKKGYIKIIRDGKQTGYSNSVKNAKLAIDVATR